MRPSLISLVSAMRATSRRTGSKPERTTASGVSSMIRSTPGRLLERADVAALAADDPALHLLVGQVDDGDRRLRRVIGGDALHDGRQDASRALLAVLDGAVLDLADAVLGLGLCRVHDLPRSGSVAPRPRSAR